MGLFDLFNSIFKVGKGKTGVRAIFKFVQDLKNDIRQNVFSVFVRISSEYPRVNS